MAPARGTRRRARGCGALLDFLPASLARHRFHCCRVCNRARCRADSRVRRRRPRAASMGRAIPCARREESHRESARADPARWILFWIMTSGTGRPTTCGFTNHRSRCGCRRRRCVCSASASGRCDFPVCSFSTLSVLATYGIGQRADVATRRTGGSRIPRRARLLRRSRRGTPRNGSRRHAVDLRRRDWFPALALLAAQEAPARRRRRSRRGFRPRLSDEVISWRAHAADLGRDATAASARAGDIAKELGIATCVGAAIAAPWTIYTMRAFPLESAYERAAALRHITEVIENQGGPPWSYCGRCRAFSASSSGFRSAPPCCW